MAESELTERYKLAHDIQKYMRSNVFQFALPGGQAIYPMQPYVKN